MAQLYISDILLLYVLTVLRQHPGTVFQQDNLSKHINCIYGLLCHVDVP